MLKNLFSQKNNNDNPIDEIEEKIVKSGIREIFIPHQPISTTSLFSGRRDEIQSIIRKINTPGYHVLLYGERGVGKSSLANIVGEYFESKGKKVYHERCDSNSNLLSILRKMMISIGVV